VFKIPYSQRACIEECGAHVIASLHDAQANRSYSTFWGRLSHLNASESKKIKSQVDTPLPFHPATVEAWPDFSNRVASHIANLEGSSHSYSPIVLPMTKVEVSAQACHRCWGSAEMHSMFAADVFT